MSSDLLFNKDGFSLPHPSPPQTNPNPEPESLLAGYFLTDDFCASNVKRKWRCVGNCSYHWLKVIEIGRINFEVYRAFN